MSTLRRVAQAAGIAPVVYTVGLGLGGYLAYQHARGRLYVVNQQELCARRKGGTLIIANHPSIMEPWVLLGLHSRFYFADPWGMPWSTPDFGNFVDHWYGRWILVRTIPVHRGNGEQAAQWRSDIISALAQGQTVIVFPEGGRTRSLKGAEQHRVSATGRKIRPFKIRRLLEELPPDVSILPIWVERPWDLREDVSHGIPDGFPQTFVLVGTAQKVPEQLGRLDRVTWCEELVLAQADLLWPLSSQP